MEFELPINSLTGVSYLRIALKQLWMSKILGLQSGDNGICACNVTPKRPDAVCAFCKKDLCWHFLRTTLTPTVKIKKNKVAQIVILINFGRGGTKKADLVYSKRKVEVGIWQNLYQFRTYLKRNKYIEQNRSWGNLKE